MRGAGNGTVEDWSMGMDHRERAPGVRSTISFGWSARHELAAIALLVPRAALGWLTLKLGWSMQHLAPLTPIDKGRLLALALTLSGIALMLGFLTGPAAFISGSLGIAAWVQGSAMTASAMIALAMLLALAWRRAGQIGLDRWLLPSLGLVGHRGALVIQGRRRT
jgi:hypothetical protein